MAKKLTESCQKSCQNFSKILKLVGEGEEEEGDL
jgi:hypothetical protein